MAEPPNHADLRKKAEGWLNSVGFPLEMRVARTLRGAGFPNVYQGLHYRDPVENVWREIDVSTLDVFDSGWAGIRLLVRLVVECTYSASSPWVVFPISELGDFDYALSWQARQWSPSARFFGEAIEEEVREGNGMTDPPSLLEFCAPVGYGVVKTGDPRDPSESRKKDGPQANAKVAQVLSAVKAMARVSRPGTWELLLPVIVVEGELFSTRLADDCRAVIEETTGEATLVVDRYDTEEGPLAVALVTEKAFGGFCERTKKRLGELQPRLASLVQRANQLGNESVIRSLS